MSFFGHLKIDEYQSLYRIGDNTNEEVFLKAYLNMVKNYLDSKGLVLSTGQETTLKREAVNTRQRIFKIPFFKEVNLNEVAYVNGSNVKVLTNTDYRIQGQKGEHYTEICLLNANRIFGYNSYLRVKAIFGFNEVPADLHFIFLNLFADELSKFKFNQSKIESNGQELSGLRAGDITYSFSSTRSSQITSFNENKDLQKVIQYYV
jgi:hypothetical protein